MKKNFKFFAVLMAMSLVLSSCIGSFGLTNKLKSWNEGLGDKYVNEIVFFCLHVIPAYPITLLVDGLVLNSIEFWTGSAPIAKQDNGTKIVKNAKGEEVAVTACADGYTISNGTDEIKFEFNSADNSWSAVYGDEVTKLMTIDSENNSAELYMLNGETMEVELNEAGVNAVREAVTGNSFAAK